MNLIRNFDGVINSVGVHHNNHYDVDFIIPRKVMLLANSRYPGINAVVGDRIKLFCNSVTTPPQSIASTSVRNGGEKFEFAYDKSIDTFTTRFYLDSSSGYSSASILKLFQAWVDSIYDPEKRVFAYYNDIKTDVHFVLYNYEVLYDAYMADAKPEPIYEYIAYEAWPSVIPSITFDGGATNNSTMFDITWKCRYLKETKDQQYSKQTSAGLSFSAMV
jgi:hypothetical protein